MEGSPTRDPDEKTTLHLVRIPPGSHQPAIRSLVRQITGAGCIAVVVSLTLPSRVLLKQYGDEGIDLSRVFIVDAVTRYAGGTDDPDPHIRYVAGPGALTGIEIGIIGILAGAPAGKKCVLFDSVSALLIHAPREQVVRFVHLIGNKLRRNDIRSVFFCIDSGADPGTFSGISSFIDTILDAGEGISEPGNRSP